MSMREERPDPRPHATAVSRWRLPGRCGRLNVLVIQSRTPDDMAGALKRLNEILGAKYGYDPTDERALSTWNIVKTSRNGQRISLGIEIFLGIIGVLTLFVGGIGVANIMYAVVKERTREIGVKMALGAGERWITLPFVLEGCLYTALGGVIGIALATLIVSVLALLPTEGIRALEFMGKPVLSMPIMLTTTALLGFLGILAGWFPARRAAAIDPAATLRYE